MKRHDLTTLLDRPYRTAPPIFYGVERLAERSRTVGDPIWNRRSVGRIETVVCEVENALCHKVGVVVAGGTVLPHTATNHLCAPDVIASDADRPVRDIAEPCFMFRKAGENNYGHWLLELLPRIALYREIDDWARGKAVIAKHPQRTLKLRIDTLRRAGISRDDIIIQGKEILRAARVYFTEPFSTHSHVHAPFAIEYLRQWAGTDLSPVAGRRKLFVPRPEGTKRQALNQAAMAERLRARGYAVVLPELMAVSEQIRVFSEASHVVGPIGAALTNLVWSAEGTRVLTTMPATAREYFFWDIAGQRGQPYHCVVCPTHGDDTHPHADYVVPMDDFERALDAMDAA